MKKKKFSSIAVAILFVLQIFSSFGPIGSVKADESSNPAAPVDLTGTFKFITGVTLTDEKGNDISKAENVDKSSAVNVNYKFLIPGGTIVNKGDTYKLQLPEQIKISSEQTEGIKDSNGNTIASLDVDTSDKALITFNGTAASDSDVIGSFAIAAGFDEDKMETENPASIDFKIDGQSPVTVNFKQDTSSEDTSSSSTIGQTVSPGDVSASADTTTGSDITDSFHFITGFSGLTDKDGNKLDDDVDVPKDSEVHVNYTWGIPDDVTVTAGDYYDISIPKQIEITSASLPSQIDYGGNTLADISIETGNVVRFTFTDAVNSYKGVTGGLSAACYFNKDEIGTNNPVPIEFTVPGVGSTTVNIDFDQPSPTIVKSGHYDPATDEITWTITVNKENVNVANAVVEDTINKNEGQKFVSGSITIQDGNNPSQSVPDVNAYTDTDGVEKLTFNLVNITKQQIITFKTSIHDDLAAKGQGTILIVMKLL